jgi:VCBS repeat-containing protein
VADFYALTAGDGAGDTLRRAIEAANALPGTDRILFELEGVVINNLTIVLTQGALVVTDDLIIETGGLAVVIDGNADGDGNAATNLGTGDRRVFDVRDTGSGVGFNPTDLAINGLTITGGNVAGFGGGVRMGLGDLTITNSTITGNNATFSGGGVSATDLVISSSTVSNNRAGAQGGGISAFDVTVQRSTISGNTSILDGGGIFAGGRLAVDTSTIVGNQALGATGEFVYGGGAFSYGYTAVRSTTVTGNTAANSAGGIYGFGIYSTSGLYNAFVENSIVAGNLSGDAFANDVNFEIATDGNFNSIVGGDASAIFRDVATLAFAGQSVQAGVLALNGGPTQTVALARDAANPALDRVGGTATDQRGVAPFDAIPGGALRDLGSFELTNAAPVAVADTLTLGENDTATINLLANDTDADGDARVVTLFAGAAVGTTVTTPGRFTATAQANGQVSVTGLWDALAAGATGQISLGYTIADTLGATANGTLTLTFNGVDDPVVISGTTTGSASPGTGVVSGSLSVVDPDAPAPVVFTPATIAGSYGSFAIAAGGAWTFTIDAGLTQPLAAGEQDTDVFTVAAGGATVDVTITVTGVNDPIVITGDVAGAVAEDGVLVATGDLDATDADAGQTPSFVAETIVGVYGTLTIAADGAWSYELDNASDAVQALVGGETVADTITVTATNTNGESATADITIGIEGADEPPPTVITFIELSVQRIVAADTVSRTLAELEATAPALETSDFVAFDTPPQPGDAGKVLLGGSTLRRDIDLFAVADAAGAPTVLDEDDVFHKLADTARAGALDLDPANDAADPVTITATGIIDSRTLGDRTSGLRFASDAFGLKAQGGSREIRRGEAITFEPNAGTLDVVRFVVQTRDGGPVDLVLDANGDGFVTTDSNGDRRGGFSVDTDDVLLTGVAGGAAIAIDRLAGQLTIDGMAQTGIANLDDLFDVMATGIGIGARFGDGGFAIQALELTIG